MFKKIIDRLKREPVVVRGFVAASLDLAVAAEVIETGAETQYELVALGLLNLFLFKGARDKVAPVEATGPLQIR